MAACTKHHDVLLVDVRCNLVGEISLRSITKHHWTPCMLVAISLLVCNNQLIHKQHAV